MGFRYRVNNRKLPGTPDISNTKKKWAILVHGCFWHHHADCSKASIPKNNREFWLEKFKQNRLRDRRNYQDLIALGFRVMIVWECEIESVQLLKTRLKSFLENIH